MVYSKLIIPTAFLYGENAKSAIMQGFALPIAAGDTAFTHAIVIDRNRSDKRFMSIIELKFSDDDEISQQLDNICKKRDDICGLDMGKNHVMGILNLTPDSFSDGGLHRNIADIERQVDIHIEQGLKILDIGGESTRPNAAYVSCDDEIARIEPILKMLKGKNICISVDTRKAKVMKFALKNGAHIINDVSALEFRADKKTYGEDSGDSQAIILQKKCPIILMHSQGTPEVMQDNPTYNNILFEIYDYLQQRITFLVSNGFDSGKIIIDPGIGFGKTFDHNLIILKNTSIFHSLGVGIMVGASRKAFIGQIAGEKIAKNRMAGSLTAMQIIANMGVQIHRMHDIKQAINQNRIINAINNIEY